MSEEGITNTSGEAGSTCCSHCGDTVPPGNRFCEGCGVRVTFAVSAETPCACGAPASEVDQDGYCEGCGRLRQRPASDHVEVVLSPAMAGISDRGLVHSRNEDRFALVTEARGAALLVCDGVSSTRDAAAAAEVVAQTLARELQAFLQTGSESAAGDVLQAAIRQAILVLRETSPAENVNQAASTTVVAAVVQGQDVTLAWAGDSRAYWFPDEGDPVRLTTDHSWLNDAAQRGVPTDAAEAALRAHAIVRWVGADVDPDDPESRPELGSHTLHTAGTLLLCSDGLWNYAASDADLRHLLNEAELMAGGEAVAMARHLVEFAKARGGRDNITVVMWRWIPAAAAPEEDSVEPAAEPLRTAQGEA